MKKTPRKLALHRESLRHLTAVDAARPVGGRPTRPSIDFACTSEYTWYCPTASACSVCPICEINN